MGVPGPVLGGTGAGVGFTQCGMPGRVLGTGVPGWVDGIGVGWTDEAMPGRDGLGVFGGSLARDGVAFGGSLGRGTAVDGLVFGGAGTVGGAVDGLGVGGAGLVGGAVDGTGVGGAGLVGVAVDGTGLGCFDGAVGHVHPGVDGLGAGVRAASFAETVAVRDEAPSEPVPSQIPAASTPAPPSPATIAAVARRPPAMLIMLLLGEVELHPLQPPPFGARLSRIRISSDFCAGGVQRAGRAREKARPRGGAGRERGEDQAERALGRISARARKARPRWLMASFSAGASSALERVSPSGRKIGS